MDIAPEVHQSFYRVCTDHSIMKILLVCKDQYHRMSQLLLKGSSMIPYYAFSSAGTISSSYLAQDFHT